MNTMKIVVKEAIGLDFAITPDLGKKLRDAYGDKWQQEPIELDFTDIRTVSSSFLAQATKPIVNACEDDDELDKRLSFVSKPPIFDSLWPIVKRALRMQT